MCQNGSDMEENSPMSLLPWFSWKCIIGIPCLSCFFNLEVALGGDTFMEVIVLTMSVLFISANGAKIYYPPLPLKKAGTWEEIA